LHGIVVIRAERKGGDVFVRAAGGIRMHRAEGTIQIGSTLRVLHSEASSCPYEKVSRRGKKCPFVPPPGPSVPSFAVSSRQQRSASTN
jgi:hypothetical protein